ncbi:MAG TPA: DUF1993 domain-containing protein [Rhizomicrobium sp.]
MSFSMYQASVPAYTQMLKSLAAVLKKAEAHCEAKKIDPSVFVNARLYPDMAPLSRQIQIATDQVKGGLSRLTGSEPPSWEDKETTFADLQARLQKALDFAATIKPEQIDGSETRDIVLKVGGQEMPFKGQQFLVNFSLPNFYFHIVTAYDILRHNGVEIGKRDFLGGL